MNSGRIKLIWINAQFDYISISNVIRLHFWYNFWKVREKNIWFLNIKYSIQPNDGEDIDKHIGSWCIICSRNNILREIQGWISWINTKERTFGYTNWTYRVTQRTLTAYFFNHNFPLLKFSANFHHLCLWPYI